MKIRRIPGDGAMPDTEEHLPAAYALSHSSFHALDPQIIGIPGWLAICSGVILVVAIVSGLTLSGMIFTWPLY
ncbi:MAG: hypothetical protein CMP10_18485 [Zetaproteobacteria bacterium]|nr:hypothetical protein [Pseudobdellovibrionaceae bacterium]|tara:strand:+ start:111 stop:329 length:219 start_codon:yes stop_codon:yes gene_type:complete